MVFLSLNYLFIYLFIIVILNKFNGKSTYGLLKGKIGFLIFNWKSGVFQFWEE
jgi:hypothetical protein